MTQSLSWQNYGPPKNPSLWLTGVLYEQQFGHICQNNKWHFDLAILLLGTDPMGILAVCEMTGTESYALSYCSRSKMWKQMKCALIRILALAGVAQWIERRPAKLKGRKFSSQSGHMPGLRARSPVGGAGEATTQWCFSPSLSPSRPLSRNK